MTDQEFIFMIVATGVALVLFFGKGDGFRPKIQRARAAAEKEKRQTGL
jgi:hypothetical protein